MSEKIFLPVSRKEMSSRGWDELDIILVTGDAYVDHPSYGTAIIGRVLEDAGYKVGVIAQPDWRNADDFKKLGRPKLFFGVTAGNIDSMVAHYTANKKRRKDDDYSPGGRSGLRPDRSTIVYTNRIKEAFSDMPVVIGGLEASMRRLAHYDYWSDTVRRSILLDSKADILVYGMGEKQILAIAGILKEGKNIKEVENVKGTVIIRNNIESIKDHILIPSFEEMLASKDKFNFAFKIIHEEADPFRGKTLIQKHDKRYIVQYPPALPLSAEEMDDIYLLSYTRKWHPVHDKDGGIPGFEAVRFSVVSHRGCPGGCSFCSLFLHQGRIVQSRTAGSIIKEVREIAADKDFTGTITDIGGPTANLYEAKCQAWEKDGACRNKKCLVPSKCPKLKLGYNETMRLWDEIGRIPKVKHLFVGSGVRYDLLMDRESDEYLRRLCERHVSGYLKIAPEHSVGSVLALMNKPSFDDYDKFVKRFQDASSRAGKKQYLVNYFITAHPGSGLNEALTLALDLSARRIRPEQIQDFIPLPMTISGAMYYTGKDPFSGKNIYVSKGLRERKLQRALIQHDKGDNKRYVVEVLRKLNKLNLMSKLK